MPAPSKSRIDKRASNKGKTPAPGKTSSSTRPLKASAKASTGNRQDLDALSMLERDHREVEQMFEQFSEETGDAEKRAIANAIACALKVHACLEEEFLYPAAAAILDDRGLVKEALVEHAAAKDLIAQIEAGAPGEALYDARIVVLRKYVAHHVAEEEGELFPRCRSAGLDTATLGAAMAFRKQELSAGFVVSNPANALPDATIHAIR